LISFVNRTKKAQTAKFNLEKGLRGTFGNDQLLAVAQGHMRGKRWADITVKKSLQLRFACGTSGYNTLLQLRLPFPSVRTLQRRMESYEFRPGIQHQTMDLLQLKVQHMDFKDKYCVLTLDEMSITPQFDFNVKDGSITGGITLPADAEGPATHALVFMVAGAAKRWKQIVAYHFTGNSVPGEVLKSIVLQLIQLCSAIGLFCIAVTSDMGSSNRALWNCFNVGYTRNAKKEVVVRNKIPHPVDPDRSLFFLADVPHLFKNIKTSFIKGTNIHLPSDVTLAHSIPEASVSVKPLSDLVAFQSDKELKLAPKLTANSLKVSHFNKMRVDVACQVLSPSVAAALRYMVENEGWDEDVLTTAWFVDLVAKWFNGPVFKSEASSGSQSSSP
jgi:hypothetical protein